MAVDLAVVLLPAFHTKYNATPINTYRVVHTGPKIELGGFHAGLLIVWYQPFTPGIVK